MTASNPTTVALDSDEALIARALHDAAGRHFDQFDPDFYGDPDIGHAMRALLERKFLDFARAFAEAAALRKALNLGYLPPPDGATPESVCAFLAWHETKRETKATRRSAVPEKLSFKDEWGETF